MVKVSFSFLIWAISFSLHAQTLFTPSIPSPGPVGSQTLMQFSLNNLERETRTFSIQGVVSDQMNNRLASFAIMPFAVKPGVFSSATANLRFTRFQVELEQARAYFNQHGILPPEAYTVCYQLSDGLATLPEVCVNITATDYQKPASKAKKPLWERALAQVNFYGGAQFEQVYATRQGTATEVPRNITRFMANPGISMFHIPVSANILLTSENSGSRQQMNIFSLSFDQQMFLHNLQTAVVKKLVEENQKKLGRYGDVLGSVKDYDQLESFLQNPEFLKEQALAKTMGEVNQSLGADQQQWMARLQSGAVDGEQVKSLFSLDEAMKQLPAGSPDLLELQSKKDSLMQVSSLNPADLSQLAQLENTLATKGMSLDKVRELEAKKKMAVKLYQRYETVKKVRDRIKAEGIEDQIKDLQNFDYSTLNNPVILRDYAAKFGLDSRLTKWLFGLRHLSVGNIFPTVSPLMLEGIMVGGVSAEINPGILNMGLTTGWVNRPILNPEKPEKNTLDRKMIAGKLGLGKSGRSGFNIHFMRIWDEKNGFVADSSNRTPQANFVFGPEVRLSLFKRRLLLTGTGFISQYVRDQNASDFEDETVKKVNQEIALYPFLFPVNSSTSVDYSYDLNATLDLGRNLFLTVNNKYIGPGYVTLGNPFLRNDLRRYEGRMEKRLFKNRLVIGGFLRNEHDNLFQFKNIKTERTSLGAQADLRMERWPSLRMVYSPMFQTNRLGDFSISNFVFSASHSYRISQLQMSSSLHSSLGLSHAPVEQPRYYALANTWVQSLFLKKLTINLTYNQTRNEVADLEEVFSVLDLSGQYQITPKIMAGAAINLSDGKELSRASGYRLEAIYRLNRQVDVNLRYLRNSFTSNLDNSLNFNENLLNVVARFSFN